MAKSKGNKIAEDMQSLITIQLTQAELESLPLPLRRKISRRWKRLVNKQEAMRKAAQFYKQHGFVRV